MKNILFFSLIVLVFQVSCNLSSCNNNLSGNQIISEQQHWLGVLPDCPCEMPDQKSLVLGDGWAKDQGDINKYHRGADICFRSYPPVPTNEGASGQQCCYDSSGQLITAGSGAGTPDKESTCDGEDRSGVMKTRYSGILLHYKKDVKPWLDYGGVDSGWVKYNLEWIPNNDNNCLANIINGK